MNISDIHSIELDMTKAFNHCIRIKDKSGNSIQVIPVREDVANEQLAVIYKAWASHPDFNPEPPTEQELYEKRK